MSAPPAHPCLEPGCTYTAAKNLSALLIHTRTHTGERPFKCKEPFCPYKGGAQNSALLAHMRAAHLGGGFKCAEPRCTYVAQSAVNLKDHQPVHTRVRAFPCPAAGCTYASFTSSGLSAHMRRPKCSGSGLGARR